MELQFVNKSKASSRTKTPEGYLDVPAVIYRSGVFRFSLNEAPFNRLRDDLPQDVQERGEVFINVPDEAIQDGEFLDSVAARPVTNGHPSEFVNSKTNRYLQLGMSKGPARVENGPRYLLAKTDLRLTDAEIVERVENEDSTEVSIGNIGILNLEAGTRGTEKFDGTLDKIRVNHIAIVNRGRGGRDVRLLNDQTGDQMEKVTKIFNGIEVEVAKDNEKLFDSLATKIENQETELATIRAELENEKTIRTKAEKERDEASLSDERVQELVNERAATIATAKKLSKDVDESKSTREIKVDAIKTVNAELISDDAIDQVVNAVFETLAKTDRTESQDAGTKVQNAINGDDESDKFENEDPAEKAKRERRERRQKKFAESNFGK